MNKQSLHDFLIQLKRGGDQTLISNPHALRRILLITKHVQNKVDAITGAHYGLRDTEMTQKLENHICLLEGEARTANTEALRLSPEVKKYVIGICRLVASYVGGYLGGYEHQFSVSSEAIIAGKKNFSGIRDQMYQDSFGHCVEDLVMYSLKFATGKVRDNHFKGVDFNLAPTEMDHMKIDGYGKVDGIQYGLQITIAEGELKRKNTALAHLADGLGVREGKNWNRFSGKQSPDSPVLIYINKHNFSSKAFVGGYNRWVRSEYNGKGPIDYLASENEKYIIRWLPHAYVFVARYLATFIQERGKEGLGDITSDRKIIIRKNLYCVAHYNEINHSVCFDIHDDKINPSECLYSFTFFKSKKYMDKLEAKKKKQDNRWEEN